MATVETSSNLLSVEDAPKETLIPNEALPTQEEIDSLANNGVAGEEPNEADTANAEKESESTESEEPAVQEEAEESSGIIAEESKEASTDEDEFSLDSIMSDEGKPESTEETKEKPLSQRSQDRIEKKINTAIKRAKIAEDENTKLKSRITELEVQTVSATRPVPPVESECESTQDYQQKLVKWRDDDEVWVRANKNKEQSEAQAKQRNESNVAKYLKNNQRMIERFDDYQTLCEEQVNYGHLSPVILESDFAPEICYYLAKHPKTLGELLDLDNISATLAIGELSGQFKSIKKRTTKATKPLKPVNTSSTPSTGDGISTQDIDKISQQFLGTQGVARTSGKPLAMA